MLLSISHRSTFSYSLPARSNINELRLSPDETARQLPGVCELSIDPEPEAALMVSRDLFGNLVHAFEIERKHAQLEVVASSQVETKATNEQNVMAMERTLDVDQAKSDDSLFEYLTDSRYVQKSPEIWREAVDVSLNQEQTWGAVMKGLSDHIFASCQWTAQMIHRATTAAEVCDSRKGTCQDFTHLLLGYCRALGIPGRYVSGYLYDPGREQMDEAEASFIGSEVSHAWVEFYTPEVGWVGIDPTNACWVDEHYVTLAKGKDYGDVAPIRGNLLGGGKKRSLDVEVVVKRLD